jgi:hypothetical protein
MRRRRPQRARHYDEVFERQCMRHVRPGIKLRPLGPWYVEGLGWAIAGVATWLSLPRPRALSFVFGVLR